MNKNETTFRLVNRISKDFSIIISNFEYAATLLANIRSKLRINLIMSLLTNISSSVLLRKIKISISQVKLITSLVQTINSKTIRISIVFRQRMSSIISIYLRNPISFVSKARQKILSTISDGKLIISTSPVFVILFTLGHWDVYTLLPLDSMTLGDMDYTVV